MMKLQTDPKITRGSARITEFNARECEKEIMDGHQSNKEVNMKLEASPCHINMLTDNRAVL